MAWGKVDLCGLDTSKLPVLTPQRMQELYPLVHSGDKAARDEFIQGNLRLVLSVIQRFSGRGENVDDLFQVGCIGLMKALDNFDVSQNVRFSTYAVPMVIGEIRRYLRDNNASASAAPCATRRTKPFVRATACKRSFPANPPSRKLPPTCTSTAWTSCWRWKRFKTR